VGLVYLSTMKIYLGADHGGFSLKESIKKWLQEWGIGFEDCGNHVLDPVDDYPDYAKAVAMSVASDKNSCGILACRSAAGVVIAANKVAGVRCASAFNEESAMHSREHNDTNILALSGDWLTQENAKNVLKAWLETPVSEDPRHVRRRQKIADMEKTSSN
jgi:ribose 5-phosphate isomerase B